MLNENQITDILSNYLESTNHQIIQKLTSKQKGIDLITIDSIGVKNYYEVKGDTSCNENSKRFGKAFNRNQIWNHVSVAVVKTMILINDAELNGGNFAMAFPISHKSILSYLKPSLQKLGIVTYLVSESNVELL